MGLKHHAGRHNRLTRRQPLNRGVYRPNCRWFVPWSLNAVTIDVVGHGQQDQALLTDCTRCAIRVNGYWLLVFLSTLTLKTSALCASLSVRAHLQCTFWSTALTLSKSATEHASAVLSIYSVKLNTRHLRISYLLTLRLHGCKPQALT